MRSMMAESQGQTYRSYVSLAEAVANRGVVVLQGDYGGQIYLTCPAAKVQCSEPGLKQLLAYLDAKAWQDSPGAAIYFEDFPANSLVPGGMGGGLVTDDVWLHPELKKLAIEDHVRSFVVGAIQRL